MENLSTPRISPEIISLSGYFGAGKNLFADILQRKLYQKTAGSTEHAVEYTHKSWAAKLKQIASILLSVPTIRFEDPEFKKQELPKIWQRPGMMTYREFLQQLGTEAIRNNIHTNAWTNALWSEWRTGNKWIITDTRFANEAKSVKLAGGILVKVNRHSRMSDHPSETSIDAITHWDWQVDNTGDIIHLEGEVAKFMQHFNL